MTQATTSGILLYLVKVLWCQVETRAPTMSSSCRLPPALECWLIDAQRAQVCEVQQSLVDSLNAAAMALAKAEQDSSASLKDARPHCAARIALSEAVSPPFPGEIIPRAARE